MASVVASGSFDESTPERIINHVGSPTGAISAALGQGQATDAQLCPTTDYLSPPARPSACAPILASETEAGDRPWRLDLAAFRYARPSVPVSAP